MKISRMISIHAPPRGATTICDGTLLRFAFQFTPLREGRRVKYCPFAESWLFQFTPLREGRRWENIVFLEGTDRISIHAPPRGATRKREKK